MCSGVCCQPSTHPSSHSEMPPLVHAHSTSLFSTASLLFTRYTRLTSVKLYITRDHVIYHLEIMWSITWDHVNSLEIMWSITRDHVTWCYLTQYYCWVLWYSPTPQALQYGFLDFNNFCVDEYEFYEVSCTKHLFRSRSTSSPYELVLHLYTCICRFFFLDFFSWFFFFFWCSMF